MSTAQPIIASDPRRNVRVLHASVFALSLATLLLAAVLEIQGESFVALSGWTLPETCVWRCWLEMNCPGCGMTRAFICLVRGNLAGAWQFNAAALPLFAAVALQIPYRGWQLWRLSHGKEEWTSRWQAIVPLLLVGALIVRWFCWLGSFLA